MLIHFMERDMEYNFKTKALVLGIASALMLGSTALMASSHREAPLITEMPKVDGTDFYMFNSYEEGREGYVTLIANYFPLQDAYGGPNYFAMDPNAIYEIHVDNNGDAVEDITFQFNFKNTQNDVQLDIGDKQVSIPLINTGPITAGDSSNLHRSEEYTVKMIRGDRRSGYKNLLSNAVDGKHKFTKPVDNIGNKSLPDYASYADQYLYDVNIPGCGAGKMFVGQRKEPFVVNLGEVFDLVNTNPVGPADGEANELDDKNVTSIALEIPKDCLAGDGDVIGAWTTSSLRQVRIFNPHSYKYPNRRAKIEGGAWTQVSRLGAPLVNELVIGLKDKDRFNASEPKNDANAYHGFGEYVTNPTLPALLEILFGVQAPDLFPRTDLVKAFLTGFPGLNQPENVVASEMLRLNVTTAAVLATEQNTLGVIAGDVAGFPNGRRPGDDVVDIALRVVMGVLLDESVAPNKDLPYTDGAHIDATMFDSIFPYFLTPLAGSPN